MKRITLTLLTFLGFCSQIAAQDTDNTNRLWDNKPAKIWLEALPIGNGRIGGMIYGGPRVDEIQLNEDSFWSGGPHNNNSSTAASNLATVRNYIFNGQEKKAEDLINQQFIKGPTHFPVSPCATSFPTSPEVRRKVTTDGFPSSRV